MSSLILWLIGGILMGLVIARYARSEDGRDVRQFIADKDSLERKTDACVHDLRARLDRIKSKQKTK